MQNRSIAVWCKPRANTPASLEAHFNYWRLVDDLSTKRGAKDSGADFLEIGLMLADASSVDNVCVFLPNKVDIAKISDCFQHFSDRDIAQGIFNEILACAQKGPPGPRCVELTSATGIFCRVHGFVQTSGVIDSSDLQHVHIANGTLLTITRKAIDEAVAAGSGRSYFRLRFQLDQLGEDTFVRIISAPDRLFHSGFEEVQYLDFRLNEARTLPDQIEQQIRRDDPNSQTELSLVAFLTAVPAYSELAEMNDDFYKLRVLEYSIWKDYVSSPLPKDMVVYHWKQNGAPSVSKFSAFIKLTTRRSGRATVLKYLVVAFALGLAGNLAANLLQWGIPAAWSTLSSSSETKSNAPTPGTTETQSSVTNSATPQ